MKKPSRRQMKALYKAGEKWHDICFNGGVDEGPNNCECCKLYSDTHCRSCLIAMYVGDIGCLSTPYINYRDLSLISCNHDKLFSAALEEQFEQLKKPFDQSNHDKLFSAALEELYFINDVIEWAESL